MRQGRYTSLVATLVVLSILVFLSLSLPTTNASDHHHEEVNDNELVYFDENNSGHPLPYKKLDSMPTPTANFLASLLMKTPDDLHFINFKSIDPYLKYADEYGDLVHYKLSRGGDFVLVSDAEDLKEVYAGSNFLARPEQAYFGYTYGRVVGKKDQSLVEGLSNSKGPKWYRIRTLVDQIIKERLPSLIPEFNAGAKSLVETIRKNSLYDDDYEPYDDIFASQINLMGIQAYGREEFNKEVSANFVESVGKWFQYFPKFLIFEYKEGWPLLALPLKALLDHHLDVIASFQKQILANKRASPGRDWMSLLANAKDLDGNHLLTDEEVMIVTFDVFVLGAVGSGPTALEYSFYLLGKNRAVQERLAQSLHEGSGVGEFYYGAEHLQENTLLQNVVKETLRQYPPGGGINGRATMDTTPLNQYLLPPAAGVIVNALRIHHDKRYWSKPEEFNPDRFNQQEPSHPSAFTPFGDGKRRCPGYQHGFSQLQVLFAHIYNSFEVVYPLDQPPQMIFQVVARPKHHFPVLFKDRSRQGH